MRRDLTATLIVLALGLVLAHSSSVLGAPKSCVQTEPGKLQCVIVKAADCDKIDDLPYGRELFCAAAYSAAQAMVSEVAKTVGAKDPTDGFFFYYQATPDPVAQTTIGCMDTPAPYPGGSKIVGGAGVPLCNLVAYVTSPGPDAKKERKENPIPKDLRGFPDYFSKLYSPDKKFELTKFRTGSAFDSVVTGLGAAGTEGFMSDYKKFSPSGLYDPDHWVKDAQYHGISGGGGGGWGGEIAILAASGPVVQLAFGGGGGGGMNSFQPGAPGLAHTGLGAGGGGGSQFANGYRFNGTSYNGLSLGAGVGNTDSAVQYSYYDFDGSTRVPPPSVHDYNPPVIAEYQTELDNLADQLKTAYKNGKTIVIRGGGGMGAGTQYMNATGQSFLPVALSTQGGFQFGYEFARKHPNDPDVGGPALDGLNAEQQNVYEIIGDSWLEASQIAFAKCGSDYANFACMCPVQHAAVICLVKENLSSATKIPGWLQQRHCPGDDTVPGRSAVPGLNGTFSSYQRLLLSQAPTAACTAVLSTFFTTQNTPNNEIP